MGKVNTWGVDVQSPSRRSRWSSSQPHPVPCPPPVRLYIGLGGHTPEEWMLSLTRRRFVGWIGAISVLVGLRRSQALTTSGGERQPASLPQAPLMALAQAVLPSSLGAAGMAKAVREFTRWLAEYRAGTEVLHPYGSAEITYTGASPLASWRAQLTKLETQARARYGMGWVALGIPERQELVRAALAGQKLSGMPSPLQAPHLAAALMAHFYDSPEATDLCYQSQIGKKQCRPMVHNTRQPLPLASGRKA